MAKLQVADCGVIHKVEKEPVADDFVKAGAEALIGLEIKIPQGGAKKCLIKPVLLRPASD